MIVNGCHSGAPVPSSSYEFSAPVLWRRQLKRWHAVTLCNQRLEHGAKAGDEKSERSSLSRPGSVTKGPAVWTQKVSYICFTPNCLCYESRLQAEPITANETISDSWNMGGGAQTVLLISHILSPHLHNYRHWAVCVYTVVYTIIWMLEVTANTHARTRVNYKVAAGDRRQKSCY